MQVLSFCGHSKYQLIRQVSLLYSTKSLQVESAVLALSEQIQMYSTNGGFKFPVGQPGQNVQELKVRCYCFVLLCCCFVL